MQLWTHHPSVFRVNDPDLVVDYRKGEYAKKNTHDNEGFRYCNVLPKLHKLLETTQFLWCCKGRGCYPRVSEDLDKDLSEWELNVPLTQIVTCYSVSVWEDIVWSRSDDWKHLLIPVSEIEPAANDPSDFGALVRVPLNRKWATCHGLLQPIYPNT